MGYTYRLYTLLLRFGARALGPVLKQPAARVALGGAAATLLAAGSAATGPSQPSSLWRETMLAPFSTLGRLFTRTQDGGLKQTPTTSNPQPLERPLAEVLPYRFKNEDVLVTPDTSVDQLNAAFSRVSSDPLYQLSTLDQGSSGKKGEAVGQWTLVGTKSEDAAFREFVEMGQKGGLSHSSSSGTCSSSSSSSGSLNSSSGSGSIMSSTSSSSLAWPSSALASAGPAPQSAQLDALAGAGRPPLPPPQLSEVEAMLAFASIPNSQPGSPSKHGSS